MNELSSGMARGLLDTYASGIIQAARTWALAQDRAPDSPVEWVLVSHTGTILILFANGHQWEVK